MTIVARLSALLTANTTQFESNLKRANSSMSRARQSWNSDLNRAGRSFSQFDTHIKKSIGSITDLKTQLGGLAVGVASALSVQKIIQYSDTWKQLEGRLRIVSKDIDQVTASQEDLFNVAQRTRQPLEGIVSFYTRLKQFVPEAERAQYDFLGVTESVASALAITGESGASATAAMIQFTQAIGTDFQAAGQEIRSLQEQAPRLALALSNALGGGTKSLKELQQEGILTRRSVLNALGSISQESVKLRQELGLVPVTVSQAFGKLDNAFLKFIGQTDAIRSGTGSIAMAITSLADNFDLLAKAVVGIGVVFGARLITPLLATAGAFATASAASISFTFSLGRILYGSSALSAAMIGLTAATTSLGGAMALLGGPIGVALIAAYAAWSIGATKAEETQKRLNEEMMNARSSFTNYIGASNEAKNQIISDAQARIQAYQAELQSLIILSDTYSKMGFLKASLLGVQDIVSNVSFGLIDSPSKNLENIDLLRKNIKELQGLIDSTKNTETLYLGGSSSKSGGDKTVKKIDSIVQGLKDESEQLTLQTKLYGKKESAIERAQSALKIQQQLESSGIKLTQQQQEEIDKYLDSIERQTALQKEQAEQQRKLEEQERNRKQALDQLGASFESAFEDAIVNGEKLGDVLNALGQDIIRLLTRVNITEPLVSGITSLFGGGGGIGSFIGNLFGFGSFATGIDYVPHDMYAKIHRGERVVTAAENRNMGGGDVTVVVNNNSGADVSTSARNTGSGTELNIMIDQAVADNIGRKGSKTNQAISALQSRTLIRR